MTKTRLNLRMVVIITCLAVAALFSGCNEDENSGSNNGACKITYCPGLHSNGETYTQTKKAGKCITFKDAIYTREGYTQLCWSKNENGSSSDFYPNDEYWSDEDLTLYPYWEDENYKATGIHYKMPANVSAIFKIEEPSLWNNQEVKIIKIGEYYFTSIDALILGEIIRERYFKLENDEWQEYERHIGADLPPIWIKTGYKWDYKNVNGRVFEAIVAEDVYFIVKDLVPDGKETVAGVLCNRYVICKQEITQMWCSTFLIDPITKLLFKITLTIDDVVDSTFEVTSWDTSVTGFGGIDLP